MAAHALMALADQRAMSCKRTGMTGQLVLDERPISRKGWIATCRAGLVLYLKRLLRSSKKSVGRFA